MLRTSKLANLGWGKNYASNELCEGFVRDLCYFSLFEAENDLRSKISKFVFSRENTSDMHCRSLTTPPRLLKSERACLERQNSQTLVGGKIEPPTNFVKDL